MLNNSQDIQALLAGPKFPNKEFIRSGATFGEVYAMAAKEMVKKWCVKNGGQTPFLCTIF
jgi:hypothetical protein